jgi:hypothetical protein
MTALQSFVLTARYHARSSRNNKGSRMSSQLSRRHEIESESPRFRFAQGRYSKSGLTVVHAETPPPYKEAVAVFVDIIRDIAGELAEHPVWQMEVIDETGKPVYRLKVIGESVK